MAVTITTLSENTANYGLLGEWGLSILVEAEGKRILFDTGLGASAVHNAHVLRVDLRPLDGIVLSHGHNDHTGGLRDVLRETGPVEVIGHPEIWKPKRAGNRDMHIFIGIPFRQEELESLGASFNLTRDPVWIGEDIVTTGEIPMVTDYEQIDPHVLLVEGDDVIPDPVVDDLSLVVKTEDGLVVILGCAHRGVINTLLHAQDLTGEKRIHAVVGGIHLIGGSEERLIRTASDIRELGVKRLGVSHCTGLYASGWLAREFGDAFFFNNAGMRLTIQGEIL
jgi:7,8-dihydropterin-6-yl-methyl-4-(beta-D-ribofuranosyl)aminobenzene 5'-phosphate synthase